MLVTIISGAVWVGLLAVVALKARWKYALASAAVILGTGIASAFVNDRPDRVFTGEGFVRDPSDIDWDDVLLGAGSLVALGILLFGALKPARADSIWTRRFYDESRRNRLGEQEADSARRATERRAKLASLRPQPSVRRAAR